MVMEWDERRLWRRPAFHLPKRLSGQKYWKIHDLSIHKGGKGDDDGIVSFMGHGIIVIHLGVYLSIFTVPGIMMRTAMLTNKQDRSRHGSN